MRKFKALAKESIVLGHKSLSSKRSSLQNIPKPAKSSLNETHRTTRFSKPIITKFRLWVARSFVDSVHITLAVITYELALVETNKKWGVELSMPSRGIYMGGSTEKGMILDCKIAIFLGPTNGIAWV